MSTILPVRGSNVVGCTIVAFSFLTNGTNNPDPASIRGTGVVSVTRGGVGQFNVVLDSAYYKIITGVTSVWHQPDSALPSAGAFIADCKLSFADETANPLALKVWTLASSGNQTDFTGPWRVCVELIVQASAGA